MCGCMPWLVAVQLLFGQWSEESRAAVVRSRVGDELSAYVIHVSPQREL